MEFQKFGGRLDALAFLDLCAHWSRWKWILLLTTALNWVECGCPGCPGASAVISQPLDSEPMASNPCNPTMSPHTGASGHPGTRHTMVTVDKKKKRKGETSKKIIKALSLKTSAQNKKPRLPNVVPKPATLRSHDLPEPVKVYFRLLTIRQTSPSWT